MAHAKHATLRLSIDREYIAFVAFEMVLREIVAQAKDDPPWQSNEAAEMAAEALEAFGDVTIGDEP